MYNLTDLDLVFTRRYDGKSILLASPTLMQALFYPACGETSCLQSRMRALSVA